MPAPLRCRSVVSRHHPQLPRLVTVPWNDVARWKLDGTTTVEAALNGAPIGRRSLKRWDDKHCWWIELPDPVCRKLGLDVGSKVDVELTLASTELPAELSALIGKNKAARAAWERLTPPQQRMLREEVAAAQQTATRARRAIRGLGLEE